MWIQKTRAGVLSLAYSPDGHTLYALDTSGQILAWNVQSHASRSFASVGYQNEWDTHGLYPLEDGGLLVRGTVLTLLDSTGTVRSVPDEQRPLCEQIRPNGRVYRLDVEARFTISRWDPVTGATTTTHTLPALPASENRPYSFQFSPDERLLVVCYDRSGPTTVFEVNETGELVNPANLQNTPAACYIRFFHGGSSFAVYSFHLSSVSVWDAPTRTLRSISDVCSGPSRVLAFHPTAPIFASLNLEKVLTLFSTDTGRPIRSLDFALGRKVKCVAFSPDGLTCAVGGSNKQFAVFDVDL